MSLKQPLLLFGLPGLVLLAGGIALGAWVLAIYGDTQRVAVGPALGTILLCLGGLLAMFAALMLQAMKELLRGEAAQIAMKMREPTPGEEQGE